MNHNDRQTAGKKELEFWNFVNVCAVFLAFISLYTTAEGMNRFFFRNDRLHGYLISLAVQGILLSLNLRLPRYLKGRALPAKCCAVGLYLFTVLWSSGFSYIFMSNVIYEDTWMKDAQIELGNLYQKEKQELAEQAKSAMESVMGRVLTDVAVFKNRASENDAAAASAGSGINYENYLTLFSEDARMLQVIYEFSEEKNSSRELTSALRILTEKEASIQTQLKSIEEKIKVTEESLTELDAQRTDLIDRRARVPAGSDAHNSYTDSIDEKTENLETLREKKIAYEEEQTLADQKLSAVQSLYSIGKMTQDSSLGQTVQDFSRILGELGSARPDIEKISGLADGIYESLIDGTRSGQDTGEYGQLLEDYLTLRSDLSKAAEISSCIAWLEEEDTVVEDMEKLVKDSGDAEVTGIWREGWNQALAELKSRILLIPSAVEALPASGKADSEGEKWESGREELLDSLTRMQRTYLLELNDVEKAGNYLTGKYPAMAWFSLLFALYLDTAPMLLSAFKYCSFGKKKEPETEKKRSPYLKAALGAGCMIFLLLNSLLFFKIL